MTPREALAGAGLAGALLAGSLSAAYAADHEAGVPLTPAEAAGDWTVETGGHSICVLKLDARGVAANTYAAQIPPSCGDTLPTKIVAWTPAPDGMRLVGADGQPLIGFARWSNSLFVSHRSSGVDIQLKRGGPGS